MMFEPDPDGDPGLLAGLLRDPVRLRQRARWAAAGAALLNGASSVIDGGATTAVYLLTWLLLPLIALAAGFGSAFFISHGRGARGTLLEGVAGSLIALLACVLLSAVDLGGGPAAGRLVPAAASGLLYGGLLLGLAAVAGLGLGRGIDYAGRRIEDLDDENW